MLEKFKKHQANFTSEQIDYMNKQELGRATKEYDDFLYCHKSNSDNF